MKRTIAWLLLCVLLAGVCPTYALTSEEALEKVSSYLTEVYSYTLEEAEKFEAYAEQKGDEWLISYAHRDHPYWIYTAVYDAAEDSVKNAVTPFYMTEQYSGYPGEGTVREGLNRARGNGWFSSWDDASRSELQKYMTDWGVTASAKLAEGLALGTISAGNALHEYFISCYGNEMNWTPELKAWHDAELEEYGLTYSADPPVTEGIVSFQEEQYGGTVVEMTRFIGEVPEALHQAFSHPKLEGWTCLCGATTQNVDNRYGYGLAVFEKDDMRLLVALRHMADNTDWLISPVSEQALYTGKKVYILPNAGMARNQFTIVYENSETETERFEVNVGMTDFDRLDAYIVKYTRMDESSGSGLMLEIGSGMKATAYENHRRISEEQTYQAVNRAMSMVDITTFPTTIEACQKAEQQLIPEGYAMVSGVHLRRKTSSRSTDLGDYKPGVLVRVLGTEKGDPDPWYHVQVGLAKGYMSSRYVDEAVVEDTGYVLSRPLPVARAKKSIKLKKGARWFSGTVQDVPEGTMMHVLADCDGGWLHVSIPQGEMTWQMDVNGMDGYVKADDVQVGGTPLTLEWME